MKGSLYFQVLGLTSSRYFYSQILQFIERTLHTAHATTHKVLPSLDKRMCSCFAGIEDVVDIGHAVKVTVLDDSL